MQIYTWHGKKGNTYRSRDIVDSHDFSLYPTIRFASSSVTTGTGVGSLTTWMTQNVTFTAQYMITGSCPGNYLHSSVSSGYTKFYFLSRIRIRHSSYHHDPPFPLFSQKHEWSKTVKLSVQFTRNLLLGSPEEVLLAGVLKLLNYRDLESQGSRFLSGSLAVPGGGSTHFPCITPDMDVLATGEGAPYFRCWFRESWIF